MLCVWSQTVSLSCLIIVSKRRAFLLGYPRLDEHVLLEVSSHVPSGCGILLLPHFST